MSRLSERPIRIPVPSFFSRIIERLHQPRPVTVLNILSAAEDERLHSYLTEHYTICYDTSWQAHLRLCRDLVDAGYLKAEFEEHFDGSPLFIGRDARITIAGREYLSTLRKNRPLRRFGLWAAIYLSGIASTLVVRALTQ